MADEDQEREPEIPEAGDSDAAGSSPEPSGNAEAAKYRKRLREAEAERDALREHLGAMRRAEVERLAAGRLHDPEDLLARVEIDELLAEDGRVDADAVEAEIDKLGEAKPHLLRPSKPVEGKNDAGKGDAPSNEPSSFEDAFAAALKGL